MKFKWYKGAPPRLEGTEVDVRIEKGFLKIDVTCTVDSPLTEEEQAAIDKFCEGIAKQVGVKEDSRQKRVGEPELEQEKGSMEL